MAPRRSGQRDIAGRTVAGSRRRRGLVTMTLALPRYVIAKPLANGRMAFYFNVPEISRPRLPVADARVGMLTMRWPAAMTATVVARLHLMRYSTNGRTLRRGLPVTGERAPIYGTIRWLFQEYRRSKAYHGKGFDALAS